ncbi:MAG: calcium-binding protein [Rhodobacteraceae bacterium]|nr:MAG: calcium-binding protein [Paracoccaceae bacterium]
MFLLAGVVGLFAVGAVGLAVMMDDDAATDAATDADGGEATADAADPEVPPIPLSDLIAPDPSAEAPGAIAGGDGDDTISGTPGADLIAGGAGNDEIGGYDGDDRIEGGAGDDSLHGMGGADTLLGGDGRDTLHGEGGDDLILGEADDDLLFGHNGADTLHGGADDDVLHGAMGDDILFGDEGDDALHGGLGQDVLAGGPGEDTLFGGFGNDTLSGTVLRDGIDADGADFLNGGDGDDAITVGAGDIVTAGAGADTLFFGQWTAATPASVLDFDAEADRLVMIWDGVGEADIQVAPNPAIEGASDISLNGALIATIRGDAPDMAHIALLSSADAAALGLHLT